MSDFPISITTNPRYNDLYRSMRPRDVRRLENFNGERYLTAKRLDRGLKIVTQKLNPRRPVTFIRTMENFGTESAPLLSDVSYHLTGANGDLVVYVDKAKYHDDVLRAIFISAKEHVEQKVYRSFEQLRKDEFVQKFVQRIMQPKKRF